jgi:hypothetical protein
MLDKSVTMNNRRKAPNSSKSEFVTLSSGKRSSSGWLKAVIDAIVDVTQKMIDFDWWLYFHYEVYYK